MNNALMQFLQTSPYSYTIFQFSENVNGTMKHWLENTRGKKKIKVFLIHFLNSNLGTLENIRTRCRQRVSPMWCEERVCETGARAASSMNGHRNASPYMKQPVKLCEIPYSNAAGKPYGDFQRLQNFFSYFKLISKLIISSFCSNTFTFSSCSKYLKTNYCTIVI